MRPSWFTAASLTTTLPMRPPHLACQALEVYQHSEICPFYSYPFMRAEDPTERLKELTRILSGSTDTEEEAHQPEHQPTPPSIPAAQPSSSPAFLEEQRDTTHHHQKHQRQQNPSWTKSPTCRRLSTGPSPSDFCAFTNPTLNPNQGGISIITTPDRFRLLQSHPALARNPHPQPPPQASAHQTHQPPPYITTPIPQKGLGLLATAPIRAGTRLMSAAPAVLVDDAAWKGMGRRELGVLVTEGVGALSSGDRERVLGLSGKSGWEGGVELGVVGGNAFRVGVRVGFGEGEGGAAEGGAGEGGAGSRDAGGVREIEFQGLFVEGQFYRISLVWFGIWGVAKWVAGRGFGLEWPWSTDGSSLASESRLCAELGLLL